MSQFAAEALGCGPSKMDFEIAKYANALLFFAHFFDTPFRRVEHIARQKC
jgi:hypothetical protein